MNDDLIRRSDAINLCEKWRNRTNEHHDKNGWYIADTLLKATKELPSADRPQGEWIIEKTLYDNYNYRCSYCDWYECHAYPDVEPYNYCPNCGARMKGADDEDN